MDTSEKDIVVFYHGLCRDGFTAAWAAWKKFGDAADYIPVIWTNQSEQIPLIKHKEVYFLDYCPLQERIDQVLKENKKVVVIDHHISREAVNKSVPGSVYDINHSGGFLAWKYFHPNIPVPQICLYTEDSDIWKWSISHSEDVLNYFELKAEFDFKVWDDLARDLENPDIRRQYEEKGAAISAARQKIVQKIIIDHAVLVEFEGYRVYAVNGPRYFRSEIGNVLAKKKSPFGIVWSYTPEEISISMRAIPGEFDLVPLAEKYGGGGHKGASNFRLPLGSHLPWKIIGKYNDK
jgi:oligoribonuclease NrnB/cAMP/cGMP phosphodiesterase (DHH superfamily)